MTGAATSARRDLVTAQRSTAAGAVLRQGLEAGIVPMPVDWRGVRLALWQAPCRVGAAVRPMPPVLLLHGVTYSAMSVFDLVVPGAPRIDYSLLLRLASAGVEAHALDFAGYGLSGDAPAGCRVEDHVDQARRAAAAIRKRCGRAPVVIGWSWGGQVAARLAGRAEPADLAGLVLWGALWGGGPTGPPEFLRSVRLPPGERRLNTPEHAAADFRTPGAYDPAVRDRFVEWALLVDPTSPTLGLRETVQRMPLHDPRTITIPTLVIHGSLDPVAAGSDTAAFHDALATSRRHYRIIHGADHNVQFGHARAAFVADLLDFLADGYPPPPA